MSKRLMYGLLYTLTEWHFETKILITDIAVVQYTCYTKEGPEKGDLVSR